MFLSGLGGIFPPGIVDEFLPWCSTGQKNGIREAHDNFF